MEDLDLNVLGNILNSTWGKTSTNESNGRFSVKFTVGTDSTGEPILNAKYMAIVNFGGSHETQSRKNLHKSDAEHVVKSALKSITSDYRAETKKTIKFKSIADNEDIEVLGWVMNSPVRRAYYKYSAIFEIS